MKLLEPLKTATIEWRDDGPWSLDYGDRYAAPDAMAEAQYVFVEGNHLDHRFANLASSRFSGDATLDHTSEQSTRPPESLTRPPPPFASTRAGDDSSDAQRSHCWDTKHSSSLRIGEIGFGFGINFTAIRRAWLRHRRPGQTLHYLGCEQTPPSPDDLRRRFSEMVIADEAERLISAWPPALTGFWRISWPEDGVFLTLAWGNAAKSLSTHSRSLAIDAWVLDGFTPRINADAFTSEDLLNEISRHSANDATLATYTAAGAVRRALIAHGWRCSRRPGFGHKREHLTAQRASSTDLSKPPDTATTTNALTASSVAIIGGGLAGRLTAVAMAERGVDVILIDDDRPRASDSPAAIAHPGLRHHANELEAASFQGLAALHARLATLSLAQQVRAIHATPLRGVDHDVRKPAMLRRVSRILAPADARDRAYAQRLQACRWVTTDRSDTTNESRRSRHTLLHYPQGLALDLRALCSALVSSDDGSQSNAGDTASPASCASTRATFSTVVSRATQIEQQIRSTGAARSSIAPPLVDQFNITASQNEPETSWRVVLENGHELTVDAVVLATGADRSGLQNLLDGLPNTAAPTPPSDRTQAQDQAQDFRRKKVFVPTPGQRRLNDRIDVSRLRIAEGQIDRFAYRDFEVAEDARAAAATGEDISSSTDYRHETSRSIRRCLVGDGFIVPVAEATRVESNAGESGAVPNETPGETSDAAPSEVPDNVPIRILGAWVGASYRHDDGESERASTRPCAIRAEDTRQNQARLKAVITERVNGLEFIESDHPPGANLAQTTTNQCDNGETTTQRDLQNPQPRSAWAGRRCVTPDRLPWIGEIKPGVWLAVGFGSHGATLAPFAADVIADHFTGGIPAWTNSQRQLFDPKRHTKPGFKIRDGIDSNNQINPRSSVKGRTSSDP
ncbi:MAG: FAD-dependent oxidoreductase [Thioalkalivibrionaceae bacterium]